MPTIMVVEDDARNLELMTRFLKRAEFELLVPANRAEAIEMAKTGKPDVVLMDLGLNEWSPPADGLELTAAIRACDQMAKTPIIAVSARGFENEVQDAKDAGCTDFVQKPLDYIKLVETLRRLCGN